ncbi:MAG: sugar ABC transporter permease, partial [Myxococcales bacterium]|nr:sugar ABC transporter permease [Myxococcales bacterium]
MRLLVVAVLALVVASGVAWSVQRFERGLLEDRALLQALGVARGAARLAESSHGTRSPALVAFGAALATSHPDLHRLVVVDAGRPDAFGVRRKASTIYALDGGAASGGEPGAIADMDRPVLDRTNHLQSRFGSDAERARPLRLAELTEVSDAEAGKLRLAAYAPVRTPDGQGLIGLAAALLRIPAPAAPLPLWPFVAALLTLAVFGYLDYQLSFRPRGTRNALVGALVPLAIAVPFLSATSEHTAVQWQLEARSRDLLTVQKAADAGGEWALVSPIAGRELWSPDGALRLTRDHLGLAPADMPSTVAGLPDVKATVELHPEVADALAAPYDWALLPWAFGFALLFAALVLPILRLVHNVVRDPGVYAYVTPAVVGLVVLVVAPFTMGIGLAFYHYHLEGNAYEFIGFGNFVEIVAPSDTADIHFWRTLGVTVFWTVANVFLHVAIGLGLALLLNRPGLAGRRIYRVLLVLPWAVPSYITALLWRSLFLGEDGPINSLLGTIGIPPIGWLGDHFWTNFIPNLVT